MSDRGRLRRVMFVGIGLVLVAGAVALMLRPQEEPVSPESVTGAPAGTTPPASPTQLPSVAPVATASSKAATQSTAVPGATRSRSPDQAWQAFRARFGDKFKAEFAANGRLIEVHGEAGQGKGVEGEFRPEDLQQAIARARQVLDAARDLIGVQEGLPVELPTARGGSVSAQVYFHETAQGVPLSPYGNVTVDLGPHGELLGLSSDYLPDLQVANAPKIEVEAARQQAASAVSDDNQGAPKAEGGNHIIWVNTSGPKPEGRHAYDFLVRGRQIVVDAETGKVLYRRDRRNF